MWRAAAAAGAGRQEAAKRREAPGRGREKAATKGNAATKTTRLLQSFPQWPAEAPGVVVLTSKNCKIAQKQRPGSVFCAGVATIIGIRFVRGCEAKKEISIQPLSGCMCCGVWCELCCSVCICLYRPGPSKWCQMVPFQGVSSASLRVFIGTPTGRCWKCLFFNMPATWIFQASVGHLTRLAISYFDSNLDYVQVQIHM